VVAGGVDAGDAVAADRARAEKQARAIAATRCLITAAASRRRSLHPASRRELVAVVPKTRPVIPKPRSEARDQTPSTAASTRHRNRVRPGSHANPLVKRGTRRRATPRRGKPRTRNPRTSLGRPHTLNRLRTRRAARVGSRAVLTWCGHPRHRRRRRVAEITAGKSEYLLALAAHVV